MKRQSMLPKTLAFFAFGFFLLLVGCGGPMPTSSLELAGRWRSAQCEAYPGQNGQTNYLTREFDISTETWKLRFTVYGDKDCKTPLFSGEVNGPYSLSTRSQNVEGATLGTFGIQSNHFTAFNQTMADTFTQSKCGQNNWKVGVPQDVSTTGCIGVAPQKQSCPEEYDIVKVDGDKLFFGQRVTDMCKESGRPTKFNDYPVIRQ